MPNKMKKIFALALSALFLCGAFTSLAQDNKPNQKEWHEKMKAERVAYLTNYMDLTSAEAQKFWPIYNQAEAEKMEGFKGTIDAYKALETAINENKSEEDVKTALNNYLSAQSKGSEIDQKYANKYREILPEQKVAKLYLGEEKYRREQIHRWNRNGGNGPRGGNTEGNTQKDKNSNSK